MKSTKFFAVLLVVVIVAAALVGCGATGDKDATTGTKVKIGFAAPLTGDNALYGLSMRNAASIAIEELNASAEAKDKGITFELSAQDDAGDPKQAVNVANAIVADKAIVAVVGHFNSGCSIPASSVYQKEDVAMVTVSTNPQLTDSGLTVVNRITARDDSQGPAASELVLSQGIKKVAVVDDSTPYGQGLATEFVKAYKASGGEVVSENAIQSKMVDFSSLVTKIKSQNPTAVYYAGAHTEGALLAKQLREAGAKIPVIGGEMLFTPDYITLAGSTCEGDIATALGLPIEDQPQGPAFLEKFKAKFNKAPEAYDTYSYDSAMIIGKAVLSAGTVRADVAKAIRSIKYSGVTGDISFDSKGDNNQQVISAYKVVGGKWEPIK